MNWFECKVSYEKMMDNGVPKKVNEPYLVDALSFTEAEARIIEEMKPYISGEFIVTDIKRARIAEILFNEKGDRYYRFKVILVTLDEKSGNEKKISQIILVQASNIDQSFEVFYEGMKGMQSDYVVASVTETAIMDIFPFSSDKIPDDNSEQPSED
jgi:CRISPR/Cas system endoribonuclease Cas6 (RAMP superfamily)